MLQSVLMLSIFMKIPAACSANIKPLQQLQQQKPRRIQWGHYNATSPLDIHMLIEHSHGKCKMHKAQIRSPSETQWKWAKSENSAAYKCDVNGVWDPFSWLYSQLPGKF